MAEPILDKIHIRELRARCLVGFNDWERTKHQEVLISMTLHVDLTKPSVSDDIDDTVNYKALKYAVLERVENTRYDLVEKLAGDIAEISLADERVQKVEVLVDKQDALRFARSVAVEICRAR